MFARVLCTFVAAASVAVAQTAFTNSAPPVIPPAVGAFSNPPPVIPDPITPAQPLYGAETNTLATPETKPAPQKPAAPKLPGVGLRGTVKSVDVKAVTFTVGGKEKDHVVHISSASRYIRNGKPSTISEISVEDSFSGRIKKNKSGEEVLITGEFKVRKPTGTK